MTLKAWGERLARDAAQDPIPVVLRGGAVFVMISLAFWVVGDVRGGRGATDIVPEVVLIGLVGSFLIRGAARALIATGLGLALMAAHVLTIRTESNLGAYVALAVFTLTLFHAYRRRPVWLGFWVVVSVGWSAWVERIDPGYRGQTIELIVPATIFMSLLGWGLSAASARRRAAEAEVARLAERRRIERVSLARELHDSVARDLTIITMQSAVLRSTGDPADQEIARAAIEETARSGLDSLKRLLVVLRAEDAVEAPELVRDIEADSVVLATREVARHLTLLGFQITVGPLPEGLSTAAETTAVRVIREAATNITKHAPTGALCTIDVGKRDDAVVVRVSSDLAPTSPERVPSTGLGLESLSERLRLLGGTLKAGPSGDQWVVEATIPATPPLAGTIRA